MTDITFELVAEAGDDITFELVPGQAVSADGVTVPDGTMPDVEADHPPVSQSLTDYLAAIDEAIAAGGGGGGADVHYAVAVIDPATDMTSFTTTDWLDLYRGGVLIDGVARGDMVGWTVAKMSGAGLGIYTVTASGACPLTDPQPEYGELISVLVGSDDDDSPVVMVATGDTPGNPTAYAPVPGAVRSVNGQRGTVVLYAGDVGADPAGTAAAEVSALDLGTAAPLDVAAAGDAASGEVVKGNDTRLADARTPLAHKASHAPGGSDPVGVGHFAPDLPGVVGLGRRVGANATLTRGMCIWIALPIFAVDVKATTVWLKVGTGVASCAVTGGINAAKSTVLDAPGALVASTSVGAMSFATSAAVVGGTLTSPVTLLAGRRYFVQVLALGGASNPTAQGADGTTDSHNWQNGATGPVTPTAGSDTEGVFVWSGRSALEDNPSRASYVTSNTKPFAYVSLEAP